MRASISFSSVNERDSSPVRASSRSAISVISVLSVASLVFRVRVGHADPLRDRRGIANVEIVDRLRLECLFVRLKHRSVGDRLDGERVPLVVRELPGLLGDLLVSGGVLPAALRRMSSPCGEGRLTAAAFPLGAGFPRAELPLVVLAALARASAAKPLRMGPFDELAPPGEGDGRPRRTGATSPCTGAPRLCWAL